jgi:VWFA-related protein
MKRICIEVRDKAGEAVTGLNAESFQVALAGEPVSVSGLEEDAPLSVMVLLDVSYPALPHQDALKRSLAQFAGDLRPEDEMAVRVFGASTASLFAFSSDHLDTRRKALSYQIQAVAANKSHLWDGLAAAIKVVAGRRGRRTVIVFTNGYDSGSKTLRQDAVNASLRAGVRIDFVHTPRPSQWSGGFWRQQISQLDGAAEDSGGSVRKVRDSEDLQPAFKQLAARLMKGYCLEFTGLAPDSGPKLVKARVKTETKGARVLGPSRVAAGGD